MTIHANADQHIERNRGRYLSIRIGRVITDRVRKESNRSCPSVCFHSNFWTVLLPQFLHLYMGLYSWWRGTVVERRSLAGELSLPCARPAADGWPLMWVSRPLHVSQLGQLSLSSFLGRSMSSKLDSDVCCRLQVAPSGESYGGNRRLAESNGSLLPGLWRDSLHVTCGLTACTPGSAPSPTLGSEYGKTLAFIYGPWA